MLLKRVVLLHCASLHIIFYIQSTMLTIAAFADYACNKDDLCVIECIKEIPSSPGQEEVVLLHKKLNCTISCIYI